jgi:soluble lytic murein transglycosylase
LLTDWLARWPSGDWVKAWQIAFPRPYRAIVEREAKKNGIATSLAYAVMREESAFDPSAVSPANAYGLMQLIGPTARAHAKPLGLPADPESLKRPAINIALGCRVLGTLSRQFANNPLLAIPAYNAGPGRPRRWLRERPHVDFDVWVELIPFTETRRYTKRVLASRAAYTFLYEPEAADPALALPIGTSG